MADAFSSRHGETGSQTARKGQEMLSTADLAALLHVPLSDLPARDEAESGVVKDILDVRKGRYVQVLARSALYQSVVQQCKCSGGGGGRVPGVFM